MSYVARDDRPADKAARYAELEGEILAVLDGEPNVTARMATVSSMLADAFDDFFGDPTPSGHMGPTRGVAPTEPEDEPTQDVELLRRGEPTQATPVVPPITPEPTPSGAVPEDWWQPEPQAAPPAAPAPAAWQQAHAAPAQQAYAQQPQAHQPPRREPGRGVSPAGMVGMLVGGVLVGGLCVGGAVMALNSAVMSRSPTWSCSRVVVATR